MLSFENVFFRLCALRVARILSGHEITLGNYRNLVRQYAREFGKSFLGERPDEVMFGPMVVLWEESCVELKKLSLQTHKEQDFAEFGDNSDGILRFISANGFRAKLKPRGWEMLREMEAQIEATRPIEHKRIGF